MLASSQSEFLIYGNIRGVDNKEVKIAFYSTAEDKDTLTVDKDGSYKLFLKYGTNYTFTFLSEEKLPLTFECHLNIPKWAKQCCYMPLEMPLRMFDKGSATDTLFQGTIYTIKYNNTLKNFDYAVDIDYLIESKKIEAKITQQQHVFNKKRQKEIQDSMLIEAQYMSFIQRGNMYYKAKNFSKAKEMYEESLKIKPNRDYPKYKMEDIKTEITLFKTKENDTAIIVMPVPKPIVKKEEPKKVYTYLSPEEIDRLIMEDVKRHIESNTKNKDSVSATLALYENVIKKADSTFLSPTPNIKVNEVANVEPPLQDAINTQQDIAEIEETVYKDTTEEIVEYEIVEIDEPNQQLQEFSESSTAQVHIKEEPISYEEYQDSLRKIYPDTRTVETIKGETKTTTRVILNLAEEVTVYIRVKHDWGGVYYFIEKTPTVLENISAAYFYSITKIPTYGEIGTAVDTLQNGTDTTIKSSKAAE